MLKKMISLLTKKAEGKSIVITIGAPVVVCNQEIMESSDTVNQPSRPFIDLAKFRQMGR